MCGVRGIKITSKILEINNVNLLNFGLGKILELFSGISEKHIKILYIFTSHVILS